MLEIPPGMYRNGRPKDQNFSPDDYLYRRVRHEDWEGNRPAVDAIEMPDMSVGWSRYGHPEWLRIDEDHLDEDACKDWGVVGFAIKDIPVEMLHQGVREWNFSPMHIPKDNNYPHAEVRCYEDGQHINAKKRLNHDLHQRWRQKLLWRIRVFIEPYQVVECRPDPPER